MKLTSKEIKKEIVKKYKLPTWYLKIDIITRDKKTNCPQGISRIFTAFARYEVITNKEDTEILSIEMFQNAGKMYFVLYAAAHGNDLKTVKESFDQAIIDNGLMTKEEMLQVVIEQALLGNAPEVLQYAINELNGCIDERVKATIEFYLERYDLEHQINVLRLLEVYGKSAMDVINTISHRMTKKRVQELKKEFA